MAKISVISIFSLKRKEKGKRVKNMEDSKIQINQEKNIFCIYPLHAKGVIQGSYK
jgi:hypothetical protein